MRDVVVHACVEQRHGAQLQLVGIVAITRADKPHPRAKTEPGERAALQRFVEPQACRMMRHIVRLIALCAAVARRDYAVHVGFVCSHCLQAVTQVGRAG